MLTDSCQEIKSNLEKKQSPFLKVPRQIRQADISATALRIWMCLADQAPGYTPGIRRIEVDCRMSARRVLNGLDELVESGLLEIEKMPGRRNKYIVKAAAETAADRCRNSSSTAAETAADRCRNSSTTKNKAQDYKTRIRNNKLEKAAPVKPVKDKRNGNAPIEADLLFASDWIEWLRERGSHHAKSASKQAYGLAIAKLRAKHGLDHTRMPEMKEIVLENEFWALNLISPSGLLKKWKNGMIAVNALLDALDNKKKTYSGGLFDEEVEAIKKHERERAKANVYPIRPFSIF